MTFADHQYSVCLHISFLSFTLPHLPCKNHQDMGIMYISGGLVLQIILEQKW